MILTILAPAIIGYALDGLAMAVLCGIGGAYLHRGLS